MNANNILLSEYLKPLKTFDEVFVLLYLSLEMKCEFEMNNIAKIFNYVFESNTDVNVLRLTCLKFNSMTQIIKKVNDIKSMLSSFNKIVPLPVTNCLVCQTKLNISIGNCIITYCYDGCNRKEFLEGQCKFCNINYETDCYTIKSKKYLYKDVNCQYVRTSSQTSFEVKLLKWFDINIVRNQTTFSGFADAYNRFHATKYVNFNCK